jgi:hypothetical protein
VGGVSVTTMGLGGYSTGAGCGTVALDSGGCAHGLLRRVSSLPGLDRSAGALLLQWLLL